MAETRESEEDLKRKIYGRDKGTEECGAHIVSVFCVKDSWALVVGPYLCPSQNAV